MGVIRPPWISKEWFEKYTFNYCDHFGEKEKLATVCKICREEIETNEKYRREGKDPHDMKIVFEEISENLGKAMQMIAEDAKRMGLDLNDIPDDYEELPKSETYPLYKLMRKYGDQVGKVIKQLSVIPIDADVRLVEKAVDALAHSQFYIGAKIARAFASRWEERKDPIREEAMDAKTSAFLAYVALERNSRALLALSKHKSLYDLREKNLKFAHLTLELADMIREEFFPDEVLTYEEFGYEEF